MTIITGTFLRVLLCLVGIYTEMSLKLFAVAFFLEGFCGMPFTFIMAAYSYASDITTRQNRAVGMILVEGCLGLGASLPVFGVGYFVQADGFKAPNLLCLACLTAAILVAVFVVPESFPKSVRSKKSERCLNFRHALGFYFSKYNAGRRWKYNVTILVFCLAIINLLGRNGVETLYQMNAPFCWSPTKLGWYGALRTGLQQVLGLATVMALRRCMANETIAMLGCLSFAAGFVIEALAKTDATLYMGEQKD